jgi:CO/xanthine dehydrogenase FAD-binding subunit
MSEQPNLDRRKIYLGYALLGGMTFAAVVLAVLIDNTSARVLFGMVAAFGIFRMVKLQRSLKSAPLR